MTTEAEGSSDLDPSELFEPIYASLARDVGKALDPLEVECGTAEWLAMTTQIITSGVPDDEGDEVIAAFLDGLVAVARRHATSQALALLRALSALTGSPSVDAAAADLAASGIADRAWVAKLGQLRPTSCLRYGHTDGSQESLVSGFSYGGAEHAVVVLIDHHLGGGIKDCWVTDQPEVIRQEVHVMDDPLVDVGLVDWERAERILTTALSQPICAVNADQISDTAANLPLLRRRLDVLSGFSWG